MLTKDALVRLSNYKYSGAGYTYMDNVLTPFWNWIVTLVPLNVAPNTLTFLGLLTMMFGNVLLAIYVPTLTETAPSWVYAANALAVFVYQTLDAIDGKHARRTNTSSPLGQLFDHGCDAVSTTLASISIASALRMGSPLQVLALLLPACLAFHSAQLEEYHVGVLTWSNGLVGVTEGQLMLVAVFIVCACVGPDVFDTELLLLELPQISSLPPLPPLSLTPTAVLSAVTLFTNVQLYLSNVAGVWSKGGSLSGDEKGKKQLGRGRAVLQLLPMLLLALLCCCWVTGSGAGAAGRQPHLLLAACSLALAHAITNLILSHMCKQAYSALQPSLLLLLLPVLNCRAQDFGLASGPVLLDEELAVGVTCGALLCLYTSDVSRAINAITRHLGIYCFSVKKRSD